MYKIKLSGIICFLILSNNVFANENLYYVTLSSKDFKVIKTDESQIENPAPEPDSTWPTNSGNVDFKNIPIGYYDQSSSGQVKVKINVGQEEFLGNTNGYTAFDPNYNASLLQNCSMDVDGFCSFPNLAAVHYNYTENTSGKKYFEITVKGTPDVDFAGFLTGHTRVYGFLHGKNNAIAGSYIKSVISGQSTKWSSIYPTNETVLQFWIDYDTNRMKMMYLGSSETDYYHN